MVSSMIRVPVSLAEQKGVPWLAETAQTETVVTSSSKPKAIVVAASELHALKQLVRDIADQVIAQYVGRGVERTPASTRLELVCARLGLSVQEVRSNRP